MGPRTPSLSGKPFSSKSVCPEARKLLKYSRVPVGDVPVPLEVGAINKMAATQFCGERQIDTNLAVVQILRAQGLWDQLVVGASRCTHPFTPVLQSLAVLEGLKECADHACQQYANDDQGWRARLSALIRQLPHDTSAAEDQTAFCRGRWSKGTLDSTPIVHFSAIESVSLASIDNWPCDHQ